MNKKNIATCLDCVRDGRNMSASYARKMVDTIIVGETFLKIKREYTRLFTHGALGSVL